MLKNKNIFYDFENKTDIVTLSEYWSAQNWMDWNH